MDLPVCRRAVALRWSGWVVLVVALWVRTAGAGNCLGVSAQQVTISGIDGVAVGGALSQEDLTALAQRASCPMPTPVPTIVVDRVKCPRCVFHCASCMGKHCTNCTIVGDGLPHL